jgi:hypothetical protein
MDLDFAQTGYNRYSKLAKNIIDLCNDSNRMEDVIDDDNNVRRHYHLEDGFHVYISENGTTMISRNEISSVNRDVTNDERWRQYDVYMKYNDRACKFCIESDTYLKGIGIEYYADPQYGKDRYFLPHDFAGDHTATPLMDQPMRDVCGVGNIPNYLKLILDINRVRETCWRTSGEAIEELRDFGEQVHMVAERGYKEARKAIALLAKQYRESGYDKNLKPKVVLLKLIEDAKVENATLRDAILRDVEAQRIALREADINQKTVLDR